MSFRPFVYALTRSIKPVTIGLVAAAFAFSTPFSTPGQAAEKQIADKVTLDQIVTSSVTKTATARLVERKKQSGIYNHFMKSETDRLLIRLIKARTKKEGQKTQKQILRLWRTAPTPQARQLYARATLLARHKQFAAAVVFANKMVEVAPEWSEAYSKRSYYFYKIGMMDSALRDINKALELQPNHFMALTGKYHILTALGRTAEARDALELAATIHPYLSSRKLLGETEIETVRL